MAVYTVRKNRRYKATIQLSWIQQQFATNQKIAKALRDVGFVDVRVTGTGPKRTATGRWPLQDASAKVPDEVKQVEELAEVEA